MSLHQAIQTAMQAKGLKIGDLLARRVGGMRPPRRGVLPRGRGRALTYRSAPPAWTWTSR